MGYPLGPNHYIRTTKDYVTLYSYGSPAVRRALAETAQSTTTKYVGRFLGETPKEIRSSIESGEYRLEQFS